MYMYEGEEGKRKLEYKKLLISGLTPATCKGEEREKIARGC
jgi:hypothetical protein